MDPCLWNACCSRVNYNLGGGSKKLEWGVKIREEKNSSIRVHWWGHMLWAMEAQSHPGSSKEHIEHTDFSTWGLSGRSICSSVSISHILRVTLRRLISYISWLYMLACQGGFWKSLQWTRNPRPEGEWRRRAWRKWNCPELSGSAVLKSGGAERRGIRALVGPNTGRVLRTQGLSPTSKSRNSSGNHGEDTAAARKATHSWGWGGAGVERSLLLPSFCLLTSHRPTLARSQLTQQSGNHPQNIRSPPLQGLALPPNGIFWYKDIILMQSNVAAFPFMVSALNVLLKKLFPSQGHKDALMWSFRSFNILSYVFTSIICLDFIFE